MTKNETFKTSIDWKVGPVGNPYPSTPFRKIYNMGFTTRSLNKNRNNVRLMVEVVMLGEVRRKWRGGVET